MRRGSDAPRQLPLAQGEATLRPFDDGTHRGRTVRLSGFAGTDVVLDLTFAVGQNDPVLDGHGREAAPATDELLIEAAQVGGRDVVVSWRTCTGSKSRSRTGGIWCCRTVRGI